MGIFSKMKNKIPVMIKNIIVEKTVNFIQLIENANFDKIKVKIPNTIIKENVFLEYKFITELLFKTPFTDLIIKNIVVTSTIVNGSRLICTVVPKIWMKYAVHPATPVVINNTRKKRVTANISKQIIKSFDESISNSLLLK